VRTGTSRLRDEGRGRVGEQPARLLVGAVPVGRLSVAVGGCPVRAGTRSVSACAEPSSRMDARSARRFPRARDLAVRPVGTVTDRPTVAARNVQAEQGRSALAPRAIATAVKSGEVRVSARKEVSGSTNRSSSSASARRWRRSPTNSRCSRWSSGPAQSCETRALPSGTRRLRERRLASAVHAVARASGACGNSARRAPSSRASAGRRLYPIRVEWLAIASAVQGSSGPRYKPWRAVGWAGASEPAAGGGLARTHQLSDP
jgi:hypothetical protein